MEVEYFFQFEIIMNVLVSYFRSFEYLFRESTSIINILILSGLGPTLDVRINGPRAERVKTALVQRFVLAVED